MKDLYCACYAAPHPFRSNQDFIIPVEIDEIDSRYIYILLLYIFIDNVCVCVCNNVVSAPLIIIVIIIIACFPMKVLKNETKNAMLSVFIGLAHERHDDDDIFEKRVQKFIVYRFLFLFFVLFSFQQGNDFCIPIVIIPEVRKQIFEISNNLCKQQNNQIEYIYTGGKCLTFFRKQNKNKPNMKVSKTKKSLIHETKKNQGTNIIQFPGRFIFPLLLLLFSNEGGV